MEGLIQSGLSLTLDENLYAVLTLDKTIKIASGQLVTGPHMADDWSTDKVCS